MTLRVIQWATGGVGRAAIEHIRRHPELELVGCWAHGAEKAGPPSEEEVLRWPDRSRTDGSESVFEKINLLV